MTKVGVRDYKSLLGKKIVKIEETETNIYFFTEDNIKLRIEKFEPYCACNVGEYIDDITYDGVCNGIITNIETNLVGNQNHYYNEEEEIVYKGNITFYFENGKINMNVHGEDNGYYGVTFTMPVTWRIKED